MDTLDNLYDVLDKEVPKQEEKKETAPTTSSSNNGGGYKSGSFDPWNDEITPREINKTNLKRFDRNFALGSHGEVPVEVIEKIKSTFEELNTLGFTLRATGDNRDKLAVEGEKAYERKEYHIPFKKFNPDVEAKTSKPSKFAYEIAAKYHRAFTKVSNVVRGFLARNVHIMLGSDCNTPVNFIIIYTSCGIETTKNIKFETAGNVSFNIDLAEELNVPIFNFKNENAKERLTSFLSTYKQYLLNEIKL